jgi:hypothetical protein
LTSSEHPPGVTAETRSTCRENSRTRYDPGVHTGIISSISLRPPVDTVTLTST